MRTTLRYLSGIVAVAVPLLLPAQSLERRVAQVRDGEVEFHYASRADICGDGRHFIRVSNTSWHGVMNDATRAAPCESGPARVLLTRADGVTIRIRTYVGPLQSEAGSTNLGRVATREATAFLLGIAQAVDARTGRDAIFPATLADSAPVSATLLEIATDRARPRELRRTAMSYLAQRADEPGGVGTRTAGQRLGTIARDESDNQEVRQQALSTLLRLDEGGGFTALQELALQSGDPWLAKTATRSLAQSGDPRAREFLRRAAGRDDLTGEARVAAISGLGGSYGSAADAEFLRGLYPRLTSERQRDAAMSAIASIGGAANANWLLRLARGDTGAVRQRRKAVELAERAGATVAEMIALYDAVGDAEVRAGVIDALARDGSRPAVDKLIAIARDDTQHHQRRRAISALGKFDDPRVKEALRGLVERSR